MNITNLLLIQELLYLNLPLTYKQLFFFECLMISDFLQSLNLFPSHSLSLEIVDDPFHAVTHPLPTGGTASLDLPFPILKMMMTMVLCHRNVD